MKVKRSMNRLYKAIMYTTESKCILEYESENWIWHSRLGHVNFKAMNLMTTTNMVRGMLKISQPGEACTRCVIAK